MNLVGGEGDVLDPLAAIVDQVFLDLALVVRALVDRDANFSAGARHRLRLESGKLALDVEVAHFPEVEQPLVKAGPFVHSTSMDVVREVVDMREPRAHRLAIGAR